MKRRILAFTFVSSLLACSGCQSAETTIYSNPDGSFEAKLLDDRGGGAATSAYQTVEISSRLSGERKRVFSGENMDGRSTKNAPFGDLNISWRDRNTLLIEYCGGDINEQTTQARFAGDTVNVVVRREQRGAWPASIPEDRRAGPPPCS